MNSDLDAIERELMREVRAQQKALEEKRQTQRARDKEEIQLPPPAPWDGFTLEPVHHYYRQLQRMPRLVLEARFRQDLGQEPPFRARRDWMIEAMGRQYQREHYRRSGRAVPESVRKNDSRFAMMGPRLLAVDEVDDEPDKDSTSLKKARVSARIENPFERGVAWMAFQMIILAGPDGVEYDEFKRQLIHAAQLSVMKAEAYAQKVFAKWVEAGWVEIRFKG